MFIRHHAHCREKQICDYDEYGTSEEELEYKSPEEEEQPSEEEERGGNTI